jgi:hypothetical protein
MKNATNLRNTTNAAIVSLLAVTLITACHSKKVLKTEIPTKENTAILITNPCQEKCENDSKFIRAFAVGESIDQNTSMLEAEDMASAKLAEGIIKYLTSVTSEYSKNAKIVGATDFEMESNRQMEKTAKAFLAGTEFVCEKTYINNEKIYKTYCVIQMDRDAVEKYFEKVVQSSSKIARINFDKEAFQKSVQALKAEYSTEYNKLSQR